MAVCFSQKQTNSTYRVLFALFNVLNIKVDFFKAKNEFSHVECELFIVFSFILKFTQNYFALRPLQMLAKSGVTQYQVVSGALKY